MGGKEGDRMERCMKKEVEEERWKKELKDRRMERWMTGRR